MNNLNFVIIFFVLFILSSFCFSQNEIETNSELFRISLTGHSLIVKDNKGNEIFTRQFYNPNSYFSDLDNDGIDEFLIKDKTQSEYLLYIYNLIDTFYLTGEINSGVLEPYEIFLEEIEGLTIVAGNSDFSYLNEGNELKILPINCWKFEDGEIFLINDELYEVFITENESLLSVLEAEGHVDCNKSNQMKSLLASVYINYLNAGEKASAEGFLRTFYLCEDMEIFKAELDKIFNEAN